MTLVIGNKKSGERIENGTENLSVFPLGDISELSLMILSYLSAVDARAFMKLTCVVEEIYLQRLQKSFETCTLTERPRILDQVTHFFRTYGEFEEAKPSENHRKKREWLANNIFIYQCIHTVQDAAPHPFALSIDVMEERIAPPLDPQTWAQRFPKLERICYFKKPVPQFWVPTIQTLELFERASIIVLLPFLPSNASFSRLYLHSINQLPYSSPEEQYLNQSGLYLEHLEELILEDPQLGDQTFSPLYDLMMGRGKLRVPNLILFDLSRSTIRTNAWYNQCFRTNAKNDHGNWMIADPKNPNLTWISPSKLSPYLPQDLALIVLQYIEDDQVGKNRIEAIQIAPYLNVTETTELLFLQNQMLTPRADESPLQRARLMKLFTQRIRSYCRINEKNGDKKALQWVVEHISTYCRLDEHNPLIPTLLGQVLILDLTSPYDQMESVYGLKGRTSQERHKIFPRLERICLFESEQAPQAPENLSAWCVPTLKGVEIYEADARKKKWLAKNIPAEWIEIHLYYRASFFSESERSARSSAVQEVTVENDDFLHPYNSKEVWEQLRREIFPKIRALSNIVTYEREDRFLPLGIESSFVK